MRFGLRETAQFPVSILLEVSGPGLLSASYPLTIHGSGELTAELRLIAVDNLPSGVHLATGFGSADNGSLIAPLTVETLTTASERTASIAAPAGLVMRDADGIPLAGDITVLMVHFESGNVDALASIPGGLDVVTDEGDGLFATAGLLSVDIWDESGRHAELFANGVVDATLRIPSAIMNPDADRVIMPGDEIPLWSQDAESGTWTREGASVVAAESDGLFAQFAMAHLSLWNLDFKLNKCAISRTVEIAIPSTFDLVPLEDAVNLVYELSYESIDGQSSFVRRFRPGDLSDFDPAGPANELRFRNAPNEQSGTIVLSAYWRHYDPRCFINMKFFNVPDNTPICATSPERFGVYTEVPPTSCPL